MNMIRMIGLAAALACSGLLHAQGCSGGPGGGVDATGNQCSTPGDMAGDLVSSRTESPQRTAKASGLQRSVQVVPQVRPVALSAAVAAAPVPKAEQASRYPKAAAIMVATAKNSQIDVGLKAECSGGTDGGMDASGNQCNQPAPADTNVYALVAAVH